MPSSCARIIPAAFSNVALSEKGRKRILVMSAKDAVMTIGAVEEMNISRREFLKGGVAFATMLLFTAEAKETICGPSAFASNRRSEARQDALVTHNHGDHYNGNFCRAMEKAGKPVVSSFVENSAFSRVKAEAEARGRPDAFKIRDVAIRTFRIDHAKEAWGIDFTTGFEMAIGDFRLMHTGDCGVANDKLCVKWGRPDLWLLFPMSALDVADAVCRINPKRVVFGHLWELGHGVGSGRAHKWHIDRAMPMA